MYSSPPSTIDKSGIELILVNSGYNKRGYFICQSCGRAEVEKPHEIIKDEGHLRPYAISLPKTASDNQKALARDFCKGHPLQGTRTRRGRIASVDTDYARNGFS